MTTQNCANIRDFVIQARRFVFCRPTYHQRRMEFLADGRIGEGAGGDARNWRISDDCLAIEHEKGNQWICSLRANGVFRGHCTADNHKPIVIASTRPPQISVDLRNGLEIRVFGQKRSGHHAIIGWLGCQFGEGNIFLNDCCAFVDPFRTHVNTLPLIRRYPAFVNHGSEGRSQYEPFQDTVGPEAERAEQLRLLPKARLIVSFEDFNLECYEPHVVQPADVGESARRINLLVVRDPFNLLASVIRDCGGEIGKWKYAGICSMWKQYAREALNETSLLEHKICILYDRWFADRQYRDQLAGRFGLTNTDMGLLAVPPNGRGSSFDGLRFDGNAQEMAVLVRWREFAHDPHFWSLFADAELGRLALAHFRDVVSILPTQTLRDAGVDWIS